MEQYIQWRAAYEAYLEGDLEIFIFYKDGSSIPWHSLGDLERAYISSEVVRIKDVPYLKESLEFVYDYWGWLIPDAPGLYRYDVEDSVWKEIEESELRG